MRAATTEIITGLGSGEQPLPFDTLDLLCALGAVAVLPITPMGIPLALAQHVARRSPAVASALLRAMDVPDTFVQHKYTTMLLPGASKLLPAPDETHTPAPATGSTQPLTNDDLFDVAPVAAKDTRTSLSASLKRLPRGVAMTDMRPYPQSVYAVPVGVTGDADVLWLDMASDLLHCGIYGQSGCGKDSLMRVWFMTLCKRNAPDAIQFAILDGKGDWLTADLAHLDHMFIAPAGGYGKAGDEAIRVAITAIDNEAQRRQTLITQAGVRTREQYISKTGEAMPLLVVCATDVMTSVAGDVENLLIALVSKARSLGIRVIVSMQTPTGKDTKWRMNLSTVIAGSLQTGSQDTPALGISVDDMVYRPSQLPAPQVKPGVFVVRRAGTQQLVQAVYLNEDRFDALVQTLPNTPAAARLAPSDEGDLLSQLLTVSHNSPSNEANKNSTSLLTAETTSNEPFMPCLKEVSNENTVSNEVPTAQEIAQIAALLTTLSPSDAAKKIYGYTPSKYAEYKRKVDYVKRLMENNHAA